MAKFVPEKKAKVRVFYAEVEGDNETIQEGLRSIATAMIRAVQPAPTTRVIKALPASANGKPAGKPTLFDEATIVDADEIVEDVEEVEDLEEEIHPAPRPKVTRARKGFTYSFVKDLNLNPDGKESLKDFYAKKKPTNQQAQFTVILYYLTQVLGLSGVTADHIYHGFHNVDAKVPPDILQIARNISVRKGWVDASDGKSLKLNVTGQNFVKLELPKKTAPQSE